MMPTTEDIIADRIKIVSTMFVPIIVIVTISKTVRRVSTGEASVCVTTLS